jgi:hypothetical protein
MPGSRRPFLSLARGCLAAAPSVRRPGPLHEGQPVRNILARGSSSMAVGRWLDGRRPLPPGVSESAGRQQYTRTYRAVRRAGQPVCIRCRNALWDFVVRPQCNPPSTP